MVVFFFDDETSKCVKRDPIRKLLKLIIGAESPESSPFESSTDNDGQSITGSN